jgi:hypothetical protein
MPAVRPELLRVLLLYGLLLPQNAPVYTAIRVPPPRSRRQALLSRLIRAVAGKAELPSLDAPGVVIRDGSGGARDRGCSGRQQGDYG